MRAWALLLYLFSVVLARPLLAQSNQFISYSTPISNAFDLGEGVITDIQEDWNGFIWIGTTDGLYRFDGSEIKKYSAQDHPEMLSHSWVYSILVDEERRVIWLGTRGGLSKYAPGSETATIYQTDHSDSTSIGDDLVRYVIKDDNNEIWVSCYNKGLSRYIESSDNFENYFFNYDKINEVHRDNPNTHLSSLNSFTTIAIDDLNEDILWLGGPSGLVSFNKATHSFYWHDAPGTKWHNDAPHYAIVSLRSIDSMLFVGQTRAVYAYDFKDQEVNLINPNVEGAALSRVTDFSILSDSILNISFRNGTAAFNLSTKQVITRRVDQPQSNQIYGLRLVDSQGNKWMSSSGRLVLDRYQDYKPMGFSLKEEHQRAPTLFEKIDSSRLLQLTTDPSRYHIFDIVTSNWTSRRFRGIPSAKLSSQWRDITNKDSTTYLLLSETALYQFNIDSGLLEEIDLGVNFLNPRYNEVLHDQRGNLWVSSINIGLLKIDAYSKRVTHYSDVLNTPYNTSIYIWITAMHEDSRGRIWIRLGRSYAVYDPETDVFKNFSIQEYHGRTFKYLTDFAEDPMGNVWISSEDHGLGKTTHTDINAGIAQFLSSADGLISNEILQTKFDSNGHLWILSDAGLSSYNPVDSTLRQATWGSGIPISTSFVVVSDNQIALSLESGGTCLLDPRFLASETNTPQPYLTEVGVRDRTVHQGNRPGLNQLKILTNHDLINFSYSALGNSNPKEFSYKFEGVDPDWVTTTQRQTASYSNLKPGKYQFLIKARVKGYQWSDTKVINVILAPSWWQTIWFRLLTLGLLLLLAYLLYRWRLRDVRDKGRIKLEYQQKLNEVENQALRAQMNPHFLFNSLNSIQHFIIKNKPKEAVEYLNRFSRLMRLILQNSRAQRVSLSDEIDALSLYLELENLRFKDRFEFKIRIATTINPHDIDIPPMLIQPFIENAILHGLLHKKKKGKVALDIYLSGEELICVIEDNGIGRKAAQKIKNSGTSKSRKSMGMTITKNRIDIINDRLEGHADMEITDLYDESGIPTGTKVKLRLPV